MSRRTIRKRQRGFWKRVRFLRKVMDKQYWNAHLDVTIELFGGDPFYLRPRKYKGK